MNEKTRDEAIRLLLEWMAIEGGPDAMDEAHKILDRIAREEQMPAEAR